MGLLIVVLGCRDVVDDAKDLVPGEDPDGVLTDTDVDDTPAGTNPDTPQDSDTPEDSEVEPLDTGDDSDVDVDTDPPVDTDDTDDTDDTAVAVVPSSTTCAPPLTIPAALTVPGDPAYIDARTTMDVLQVRLDDDCDDILRARTRLPTGTCTTRPEVAYRDGVGFNTIQEAIDAVAPSSEVVLICEDTYTEVLTVAASTRRVLAPAEPGDRPILDGAGAHGILTAGTGATLTIASLDLQNAAGAPAVSASRGDLLIWGSRLRNNGDLATGRGAVVVADGSSTGIVDSEIRGNVSSYAGGGLDVTSDNLVVFDSHFEANRADYEGGAIYAAHDTWSPSSGTMVLALSTFQGNLSGYEGGGVELGLRWAPMNAVTIGNEFLANHADYEGGGMVCSPGDGSLSMFFDTFDGNTAGYSGSALAYGSWDTGDITLRGLTVTHSTGESAMQFDPAGSPRIGSLLFVGGQFLDNQSSTVLSWDQHWAVQGTNVSFSGNTGANLPGCGSGDVSGAFSASPSGTSVCP